MEGKRTTSAADWPLRLVTERALDGINEMVRLEEHADRVVLHVGIGQQSARRGEWIPSDGDPSREVCGVPKTRPAPPESVLMQREPGFGTPHGSGDLVTVALP